MEMRIKKIRGMSGSFFLSKWIFERFISEILRSYSYNGFSRARNDQRASLVPHPV